ncbi:hypothetical protein [Nocardioides aquiterrae]|uniref:Uncharacterized protein n=1 Tax=Nocardioides aquiterrae TaxID=203799 RepID=A0ABP4F413_9ACTN
MNEQKQSTRRGLADEAIGTRALPFGVRASPPYARPTPAPATRNTTPDGEPKYLYLAEQAYADTWINGGDVPIYPASRYLDTVRDGTKTPDEVMQKSITGASMNFLSENRILKIGPGAAVTGLVFENCTFNGVRVPGRIEINQYPEHSLILCMSNVYDVAIMERLGHKAALRIPSVAALKACIDPQIGADSMCGRVDYTSESGNRGHFLKSTDDQWQNEYRLVWVGDGLGAEAKWVTLAAGLAEPLSVDVGSYS